MKLVPKLSLTFIAGTSIILAFNGYFRVQREVALFESDRIRDDVLIAQTLGTTVAALWPSDGEERALALVKRADARQRRVRIRWLWLDGNVALPAGIALTSLTSLASDASTTLTAPDASNEERRYTFVRVALPDARKGAIEVSEPLENEHGYIRRTILDTIATALTLDALSAALAMILGAWLVGRPIRALMEKARRVGRGDFGEPLHVQQNDELAELGDEMNAMCQKLVLANERVAKETRARITMLEQLRHADRLMTVGKLASGIAHELGTPLNVVEARASMIANGETGARESAEYGRIIVRATEQMTRIIRQLLAFARPGTGRKERCDVSLVARHTVDLLKPLAEKKRVSLRLDADAPPAHAIADPSQLEQALTNLTMNAIQSMERPGTVGVAIERARVQPPADPGGPEGDYWRVRVRDEGAGISPEHLEHIFEPFFTTKDIGQGTGLGLSITYGIVRDLGGWIAVASEEGRGSDFSVYLPMQVEA